MVKYCPRCGSPNTDDALFCIKCGYRFGEEIKKQEITPEPQIQIQTPKSEKKKFDFIGIITQDKRFEIIFFAIIAVIIILAVYMDISISNLQNDLNLTQQKYYNLWNQLNATNAQLYNLKQTINNQSYQILFLQNKITNYTQQISMLQSELKQKNITINNLNNIVYGNDSMYLLSNQSVLLSTGELYYFNLTIRYSGLLEIMVKSTSPYAIEVVNNNLAFQVIYSSNGTVQTSIYQVPVYGTPISPQTYELIISNTQKSTGQSVYIVSATLLY
ncbi:MAG: zinc-ribbon domain-containing protein [Thermoplasmata archaeon]